MPSGQRRLILALLLVYAAAHLVWTLTGWGGPELAHIVGAWPLLPPSCAAALLAGWRARREADAAQRSGWRLFSGAFALYSIANVGFGYLALVHVVMPFPNLFDILYVFFPWAASLALLRLNGHHRSAGDRTRAALSTLTMVSSIGLILWVFLLRPKLTSHTSPFAAAIAMLYSVGDLMLLGSLIFGSLYGVSSAAGSFMRLVILGAGLFVSADLVYAFQGIDGSYHPGTPLDSAWVVAETLFAIGAIQSGFGRSTVRLHAMAVRLSSSLVMMLLVAAFAALIPLMIGKSTTLIDALVSFAVLATITLLVYWRQRLDNHENAVLARELQSVNATLEERIRAATSDLEARNLENTGLALELQAINATLEDRIHAATRDLKARNSENAALARELQAINATLEDRIRLATRDLEAQNREMSAQTQALEKAQRDLNEQNRLLQQHAVALERVSRLKSEFLANASHELRTPLNAIIGFAELLEEELYGPLNERQQAYVRDIVDAGEHLLSLINDVLDLSKIEAGTLTLHLAPVDISHLLRNSVTLLKERAIRAGVGLELRIDVTALLVADAVKLKQIIFNLLSNGIKFTPAGGNVTIEAREEGPAVVIEVRDTGIGISPEDQPKLFHPFVQVDASLSRRHEGAGLGLALCRRLVELHGGQISLRSAPGEGSTFTVTLPRHHPAVTLASPLAGDLPPGPDRRGRPRSGESGRPALVVVDRERGAAWLEAPLESGGVDR